MDKRRRQLHWTVLDRWPVTVGPPTGQTERVGSERRGQVSRSGCVLWTAEQKQNARIRTRTRLRKQDR